MIADHRFQRHFLCQRLALLQLGEYRRLVQPAAQVDREQAEHPAEQEGNPPGVVLHLCRAIEAIDRSSHQRAQQDARRQAGSQRPAGITDMPCRYMLGDEDPSPRHLPANRGALDHPQQEQRQGRPDADLRVGRKQAHDQGRHRHHEDAQGEHALAPEQVAEVGHDHAAQRPRQVAGGEQAEGLQLTQPFRHVRREEQLADHGGEEHEDDEVVELQRSTQGGEGQGLVVAAGQWTLGRRLGSIRGWHVGIVLFIRSASMSGVRPAGVSTCDPGTQERNHSKSTNVHTVGRRENRAVVGCPTPLYNARAPLKAVPRPCTGRRFGRVFP
ncbi:Uncharacterised protein [Klebsiella pneumoniae]|nr:Uncharacterised protein [Klebsiella pneumoniae]